MKPCENSKHTALHFRIEILILFVQAIDTAKFVDTLYTWSAFNTEEIGELLAVALTELITDYPNYPIENIHLIGEYINMMSTMKKF